MPLAPIAATAATAVALLTPASSLPAEDYFTVAGTVTQTIEDATATSSSLPTVEFERDGDTPFSEYELTISGSSNYEIEWEPNEHIQHLLGALIN